MVGTCAAWIWLTNSCTFSITVSKVIIINKRAGTNTAAFIIMMTFIMLLFGGAKLLYLLPPVPVVLCGLTVAVMTSEYRMERIKSFLDPDPSNPTYYQARQSLIAISTGGMLGKGLGRGVIKYGHLPEDTTDFIFSIIAEELGFAACLFVIVLFIIFAIAGVIVALKCEDRFGRLLASGIVMAITIQAAINIGVVTVVVATDGRRLALIEHEMEIPQESESEMVLPTKGIPLPFISAGGTSMLLTAAAVGVLLSVARHGTQMAFCLNETSPATHKLFGYKNESA